MSLERKMRRRPVISELKKFTTDELRKMGVMCAWQDCDAVHEATPDGQPPEGWRIVYMMKRYDGEVVNGQPIMHIFSRAAGLERDCVLCPKHARQFDCDILKPLHRELLADAKGAA